VRIQVILILAGCMTLAAQTTSAPLAATGSIQGTVIDASTNKPIAGAFVRAISSGSPGFNQSAQTSTDGSYQIKNMPAGTFVMCAWVPYQPYFDPCLVGGTPLMLTLTNGQQSIGNKIELKQNSGLIAPALAALGTGSIQGTVIDASNNKPIGGAIVTAVGAAPSVFSQSAQTSADGSYQIKNVPAGTFSVCAHVLDDRYLNSCNWGSIPLTLTLTNGQQSTGNHLTLKVGSILTVRIQDPGQLLSEKIKNGNDPDLVLGVFDQHGLFYPAHQADKDAAGTDYQLTIPLSTLVTFSIASQSLKLADSNGVQLPNSSNQQGVLRATGDSTSTNLVYTITGPRP
jgi:hypothetical protein